MLRRALERSAEAAGVTLAVAQCASSRWASATFAGARHELSLDMPASPTAVAWLAELPEAELSLRAHLVADLKIVRILSSPTGATAVIEVLTIEDR